MEPIENRLELYPVLSADERAALEAYVAAHPELAPRLEAAQAWDALFREAGLLGGDAPGEEAIAYVAAARYAEHHAPPPALAPVLARLEAAIEASPEHRARYEHFMRRLHELEAASDPAAQLEALTGHALAPEPQADRAPVRPRRLRRLVLGVAAAVVVLAAVYGALFAVSRATEPPRYRLAALEPLGGADGSADLRLRGDDAGGRAYASLREARALLRGARYTTLGLFPRYDADRLGRAVAALESLAVASDSPAGVEQEAAFLLGKARLAQGDLAAARRAFEAVVRGGEGSAPEAGRLIDRLAELEE